MLRWPDAISESPTIATRRGRKEGRHAKLSVSKEVDCMEMQTCEGNGIGRPWSPIYWKSLTWYNTNIDFHGCPGRWADEKPRDIHGARVEKLACHYVKANDWNDAESSTKDTSAIQFQPAYGNLRKGNKDGRQDTYKPPSPKTLHKAVFWSVFCWRRHIYGTGRKRRAQSVIMFGTALPMKKA